MVQKEGRGTRSPAYMFPQLSAVDAPVSFAFFGCAEGWEDKRHKASHFGARLYCRVAGRIRNNFGS